MATRNGTNKGTTNRNDTAEHLPIIMAGGGCVGLFLALLLAHSSVPNRIIVVEPCHPDPSSTRAMAHQPLTYPILSRVPGLLEELINAGSLSSGLCFRTGIKWGSKVIAGKTFDGEAKGKGQLLLPQGKFQEILLQRLSALPRRAKVLLDSKVTAFTSTSSSVSVSIFTTSSSSPSSTSQEQQQDMEAEYLIGADGAHSTIRKLAGIAFEGETLDAQLVATDIHFDFASHAFYDANFIIDPSHYGLIGRITNATSTGAPLWRVSYGVALGLSEEDIRQGVHDKLGHMLPNAGVDKGERVYEVVRIAPYKAQQRLASTFVTPEGRVCLVGDAAHLTNPYAGLGLASGIADASSLATVLTHILRGEAANKVDLLSSWSEARRSSFARVVDGPSRMAYARVRADVSSPQKVEALVQKDRLVGALKGGMTVVPPSLETRGEELEGW